ncbi:MAG: outer membrane protein assembly factor BamB family protein [Kiritimatiellia bacterium]
MHLVDPTTGETVWVSGDPLERMEHPVMNYYYDFGSGRSLGAMFGRWDYQVAARPFLTQDGRIYFTSFKYWAYPVWGWSCNLCAVDLAERKVIGRRRYFSGEILARAASDIAQAPGLLKTLEELPHKDEATKQRMREYAEIAQDTVPVNEFGPFLPFSRLTLLRHGTRFELRTGPRTIAMVYDREALKRSLAGRNDTAALFARAELALGENRLDEAATLMEQCLSSLSSEDVDLRALVNQQLHEVYRRLASRAIRRGNVNEEVSHCANMHSTVVTLTQEIETLFALAEAYERKGDLKRAAALLQSIIATYGHYHHLSPALASGDREALTARAGEIFATAESFTGNVHYGELFRRSLRLMRKELPLFFGTLSPIRRDLTVRAGDLAAAKLITLYRASPEFASSFEREAEAAFSRAGPEEQMARLAEYPGTGAAQRVLDALFARLVAKPASNITEAASIRKQLWQLTDLARLSGLVVPTQMRSRVLPSPEVKAPPPLQFPMVNQTNLVAEERGTAWLVLERHGATTVQPDWLFLAGRVKKKFDNKFILHAFELGSGRIVWKAQEQRGEAWFDEIRLKDKGEEPGFFEAFVSTNLVVVNGRYDVLAFSLSDGRLRWRYTVPFSFEIKHALLSGDLLALAGQNETIMLYIPTDDPRGEVVWQEKEEGDLYCAPWFHGDTLVSVRKMPFNLTVRSRGTGRLIGRLALPDLSLCTAHPLLPDGPEAVPLAHDGRFLVVTDGWYYIMLDVERMRVVWKRLIDANDVTREPAMRLVLGGEYLAVLKEDYDVKSLYMLSSRTGEVLWHTDPRNPERFSPIHSMFIVDGKLFGIRPHAGQGFYLVCRDCRTGKDVFSPCEQLGYESRPQVSLRDTLYGRTLVALIRDRQDFEVRAFDALDGRLLHVLKVKATGDFGEHGRASATVQNGRLILLGGNELATARSK